MATASLASHNSDESKSGNNRGYFRTEDIEGLIARLDIPSHLRRTFEEFWKVCTCPFGREIQLFKPLSEFARAAVVCERTARNHLRAFERLELIEVAVTSDGKKLVANTIRRPTTYRLRTDTLTRNRWPECKRCGHKHSTSKECGCEMGERLGRFRTKDGGTLSKTVRRTCRCHTSHHAPTPIRPKPAASQISSPPAQESASHGMPPAAAPVAEPMHRGITRGEDRVRKIRRELMEKFDELKRGQDRIVGQDGLAVRIEPGHRDYRPPLPPDRAWIEALMLCQVSEREAREKLGLSLGKFVDDADNSP